MSGVSGVTVVTGEDVTACVADKGEDIVTIVVFIVDVTTFYLFS